MSVALKVAIGFLWGGVCGFFIPPRVAKIFGISRRWGLIAALLIGAIGSMILSLVWP